jgi:hypothetical protein
MAQPQFNTSGAGLVGQVPIELSVTTQRCFGLMAQFFYPPVELLAVLNTYGPLLCGDILTRNIDPGLLKVDLLPVQLASHGAREMLTRAGQHW